MFGKIFRLLTFHSSISNSSSKYSEQILKRTRLISSFNALIAFGKMPFRPGVLFRVSLLIANMNSFQERGELILLSIGF